jgi:hypothetical protein
MNMKRDEKKRSGRRRGRRGPEGRATPPPRGIGSTGLRPALALFAPNSGDSIRPRTATLAHQVASSHRPAFGADTLGFIEAYFGDKFSPQDTRQPSLSKVYRKQGKTVINTSHTVHTSSLTRYSLNLCMTQLVQDFHFWLGHLLRVGERVTPQSIIDAPVTKHFGSDERTTKHFIIGEQTTRHFIIDGLLMPQSVRRAWPASMPALLPRAMNTRGSERAGAFHIEGVSARRSRASRSNPEQPRAILYPAYASSPHRESFASSPRRELFRGVTRLAHDFVHGLGRPMLSDELKTLRAGRDACGPASNSWPLLLSPPAFLLRTLREAFNQRAVSNLPSIAVSDLPSTVVNNLLSSTGGNLLPVAGNDFARLTTEATRAALVVRPAARVTSASLVKGLLSFGRGLFARIASSSSNDAPRGSATYNTVSEVMRSNPRAARSIPARIASSSARAADGPALLDGMKHASWDARSSGAIQSNVIQPNVIQPGALALSLIHLKEARVASALAPHGRRDKSTGGMVFISRPAASYAAQPEQSAPRAVLHARHKVNTTGFGALSALAGAEGVAERLGLSLSAGGAAAHGSRRMTARTGDALNGIARNENEEAGAAGLKGAARALDFTLAGRARVERLLSVVRREAKLEPPKLGYVYTQPTRRTVEAEKVVKQVEEKEVVEVVRREVKSLMRSSSALESFTRADFAEITEQVYGSLARRLLIEKERLGSRA